MSFKYKTTQLSMNIFSEVSQQ